MMLDPFSKARTPAPPAIAVPSPRSRLASPSEARAVAGAGRRRFRVRAAVMLGVLALAGPQRRARADGTGLLDPSEQRALEGLAPADATADAGSLEERGGLTGDWGGLRSKLVDHGVAFELAYTGDFMGVVSGGVRRKGEYVYNLDLTMTVDAEKLVGWKGATFFLYGLGNGGTGSPSENAGVLQDVDNIEAPQTWKLYEAWWQQQLLEDRFSFLAGLYNLNGEFDVLDTASVFLNSSFGIGKDYSQSGLDGPSIFPSTALAARFKARPTEHTYAQCAVLDGVAGNPNDPHGTQIIVSSDDGVLLASEVGYLIGEDAESEDAYTKLGLGGWYYSATFDRLRGVQANGEPARGGGNFGLYALGERALYREPGAPQQGLSAFGRVGWAQQEINPIGVYVGAGAVYTGLVPGRDEDRLGVAVAAAGAGHDYELAAREAGTPVRGWEVALEATYEAKLTPWLSIQPDFQYIVNPGLDPSLDNAIVLGTRVQITF